MHSPGTGAADRFINVNQAGVTQAGKLAGYGIMSGSILMEVGSVAVLCLFVHALHYALNVVMGVAWCSG